MSSPIRYAFVLAFSFCCAALPPLAISQTGTAKKSLQASVSGRVTVHGKAIAGIVVSVRLNYAPRPAPEFKATSDGEGNYRINGIPPGNYSVAPVAPAYVVSNIETARGQGKLLLLAEGDAVEGIDFSLERGGVIAGRVIDAEGRPVVEERLTLIPADQNQKNQQPFGLMNATGSQTDDRGMFRIYGLSPGQYKISVGRDDSTYFGGNGRVAYKRTFYPDATDPADAKVIEVTEGSEQTNVDITVGQTLPGFAVSGRVVDGETGRPVPNMRFVLRRLLNDNSYAGANSSVPSNSQGEFRLENVIPGKYEVMILPMQGIETRADAVSVEVVDQDVTGLLIKTFNGVSISGTVIVDGKNDSNTLAKLADLRLHVYVRSDGTSSPSFGQSSLISADGSFRLGGLLPGLANFSLSSQDGRPPANFSILRVERDGMAQPRGLEIKAGEQQVSGLKIVLRYGTGSVRGEVKLENGTLPSGAQMVVWLNKLGDPQPSVRPSLTDSRGHFLIEGVGAGDYELHAQANVPERRLAAAKQSITVADGAVTEVVISLDLTPNPGPTPVP
jgi:hypothetical protein